MSKVKTKSNNKFLNKKIKVGITTQLVLAVLLFGLAVLLSRGDDMTTWEISFFNIVYNQPEFLKPVFFVITQAGSMHMLGLVLLIFFVIRRYDVVFKVLMTSLLAYLMVGFAKDVWGRMRPHDFLPNIVNLDYVVRGPGFPSGHTAMAVAMGLVLYDYLPKKYKFIVPVWIIMVGWSRLYLGVHAPLDIVGGFAIGWISYALVKHLVIRNKIKSVMQKINN